MPIEFRCEHCNRLLRTPDGTAGRSTRCPGCGALLVIPTPGPAPGAGQPESSPEAAAGATKSATPPGAAAPLESGTPNPYVSPALHPEAGVAPPVVRGYRPSAIDAGDVLNRTWQIYSNNLAPCLLMALIVVVANTICSFLAMGGVFMGIAVAGVLAENQQEPLAIVAAVLIIGVVVLALMLFYYWLMAGQALWALRFARGEGASTADLFAGGPYLARAFLAGLLFTVVVTLGLILCIVPGLFLMIIFSQYLWLIVDRQAGVGESLRRSIELTSGNRLQLFLLGLVAFGVVSVAGMIPCGIGHLFALPFVLLMGAVTYLHMTGQSTADMLTPWPAVR